MNIDTLPISTDGHSPDPHRPVAASSTSVFHGGLINILIVDDEPKNLTVLETVLNDPSYRLVRAESADQALLALVVEEFALLILDIRMPGMTGFELAQMIKERKKTARVPIIFLTAYYNEDQHMLEGYGTGAVDYLHKPVNPAILRSKVAVFAELYSKNRECGLVNRALLAEVTQRRRADEELRELNDTLERRVVERTEALAMASAALFESGERYRSLFEGSLDAIFSLNSDGRFEVANPATLRLVGRTLEELKTVQFLEICAPDQREVAEKAFVANFRGECIRMETTVITATGGRCNLFISSAPWIVQGKVVGVSCIARDITERKQAELELAETHRRLKESFALLDTLAAKAPIGMAFVDQEFRFVRINDTLAAINGAPLQEHFGRTVQEVLPNLWPSLKPLYLRALAGESVVNVEVSGETVATPGEIRHWLASYYPVRVHTRTIGVGVVSVEVTAQKHMQEAMKEADHRKDEFLATLAHELRNPLAPIRNALQVMQLAKNKGEVVEQARTMMERQLGQMVRLVDDLLDVSRISRRKLELRKERVNLAVVLNNAVETSRPLIESSGHELTVSVPPKPIFVDADVTRLGQVFSNLLNNAAKYSEPGGRIGLTAEREGSEVVVSVKDTGVGIPPDMLLKIFDMFTQVDRSLERSQGGLGIGLSLATQLVEMHGGRVEARSEGHGQGSEFVVRLPLILSVVQNVEPQTEAGASAAPSARCRILIADDNVDSATSLSMMLEIMGNEVRTANDGLQAVDVAATFRPDVILLDIGMPNLNGYEACRRIREQPWGKKAVLIAQTGWGQDEDKRRSREAGFNHHMVKPVDPAALEKLLAELSEAATRKDIA